MKNLVKFSLVLVLTALAVSCSTVNQWCSRNTIAPDTAATVANSPYAREFMLHRNYSDHAVLQQGRPIPISGTATPGKRVKVTLGSHTAEATADKNGEWLALLPVMRGSNESYTLTVSGAEGTAPLILRDILIGEVWFCGGQSNMEMPIWTGNAAWQNIDGDKICAASAVNAPAIRLFNAAATKYPSSSALQQEPKGEWLLPTEANLKNFSAVAYFFGVSLSRILNVPVGLIESCWSGTRIQPWISETAYKTGGECCEKYVKQLADMRKNLNSDGHLNTPLAQWYAEYFSRAEDSRSLALKWAAPNYPVEKLKWHRQTKTKGELITGNSNEGTGYYWFVTHIDIPKEWANQEARLNFSFFNDCDETFFNGVLVGQTDYRNTFQPKGQRRIYPVPANLMKEGRATLAIRIACLGKDGGICRDRLLECNEKSLRFDNEWFYRVERKLPLGEMPAPVSENDTPNTRQFPSALFNSMVYPWTRFPVRGVIWYQGESNAGEIAHYRELFNIMAQDWRQHWTPAYLSRKELLNLPTMPFIYCQLSGFEPGKSWPGFRQMQQEMLQDDKAFGMAVTMDYGNAQDIHPHNKKPVGERLAAEAMRLCYGSKSITSGPVPVGCTAQNGRLIVEFSQCGLGLISTNGAALEGFEIAGIDRKFTPAKAEILNRNTVAVWSDDIKAPATVRYAWKPFCEIMNLGNRDGFPAGPFDTACLPQAQQ